MATGGARYPDQALAEVSRLRSYRFVTDSKEIAASVTRSRAHESQVAVSSIVIDLIELRA